MPNTSFTYYQRSCESCGNTEVKPLYGFDYLAHTTGPSWLFKVQNVICQNCGFVFVSPAPVPSELLKYYEMSYAKFTGQQLDYDVEKRLEVIAEWGSSSRNKSFYEIGAHMKTVFHERLGKQFSQVFTTDPNQEFAGSNDIRGNHFMEVDVIAHYFVLEHVPNVSDFLSNCWNLLKRGGRMICEVPDLALYQKDISALILHEHLNHFTSRSLTAIAEKIGFRLLESSNEQCSRSFGFVSVFEKVTDPLNSKPVNEYFANESYFLLGLHKLESFLKIREEVYLTIRQQESAGKDVDIWGANDKLLRLFPDEADIPKNVCIVDSNPKKKDFLRLHRVHMPEEITDRMHQYDVIVLMTNLHSQAILENLRTRYQKTFTTVLVFDYYNPL
jgi:hypothetical protein